MAERNNRTARCTSIPTTDEAIASYTALGGNLTPMTLFGTDPLCGHPELIQERRIQMEQSVPTPEELFAFTVNGNYFPFAHALSFLIQSTNQLSQ